METNRWVFTEIGDDDDGPKRELEVEVKAGVGETRASNKRESRRGRNKGKNKRGRKQAWEKWLRPNLYPFSAQIGCENDKTILDA